jgi:hypothetical protein
VPPCSKGDERQEHGPAGYAGWIRGLCSVEHRLDQSGEQQCRAKAGDNASSGKPRCFAQDHRQHLPGPGAHRQPDPDFIGALRYRVGHRAIDANACKQQCQNREPGGESGKDGSCCMRASICSIWVRRCWRGRSGSMDWKAWRKAGARVSGRWRCEFHRSATAQVLRLHVWQVEDSGRILTQTRVVRIGADAYDLNQVAFARFSRHR